MTALRKAALAAITLLVAAASAASFAESYRALLDWALRHGLHGNWALAWPVQVDTFIAVGELALIVALADGWSVRSRLGAWLVTLAGLAVSVAGNIGHVSGHDFASHATAAVPPLAAAAALAVGLGVLKRVVTPHVTVPASVPEHTAKRPSKPAAAKPAKAREPVKPESAELAFGAQLAAGTVPSLREVKSVLHLGTDRAREVREHLATVAGGAR